LGIIKNHEVLDSRLRGKDICGSVFTQHLHRWAHVPFHKPVPQGTNEKKAEDLQEISTPKSIVRQEKQVKTILSPFLISNFNFPVSIFQFHQLTSCFTAGSVVFFIPVKSSNCGASSQSETARVILGNKIRCLTLVLF